MYKINSLWYSSEPPNGFFSERLQEMVDVHYQNRYRWYVYNHIPRKRTMIDVGANIGIFARPSAERFEHVICFEPVLKNFEVLQKNLENYSNVELYNLGLSDRDQTATFELQTLKCGHTKQVAEFVPSPEFEKHTGELTTLDRFNFQNVDWIKIDVEGFENAVLGGSRNTIQRNRPWLLIEDNGQQDQHRQWLNDLCGPYEAAPVKSKSNTIWIPL
jgi:FkbM family methyltransferase